MLKQIKKLLQFWSMDMFTSYGHVSSVVAGISTTFLNIKAVEMYMPKEGETM